MHDAVGKWYQRASAELGVERRVWQSERSAVQNYRLMSVKQQSTFPMSTVDIWRTYDHQKLSNVSVPAYPHTGSILRGPRFGRFLIAYKVQFANITLCAWICGLILSYTCTIQYNTIICIAHSGRPSSRSWGAGSRRAGKGGLYVAILTWGFFLFFERDDKIRFGAWNDLFLVRMEAPVTMCPPIPPVVINKWIIYVFDREHFCVFVTDTRASSSAAEFWHYCSQSVVQCSKTCGSGEQHRSAECVDIIGRRVDHSKCLQQVRVTTQACSTAPCPYWIEGHWSAVRVFLSPQFSDLIFYRVL